MTREQKIAVVESYMRGLGARDFTGVPFAESVSFQSPITPVRVGRDAIEFLESIFPAIRGVEIKQHIVEGEYVSSVFDLHVTTGTVAVFDNASFVDTLGGPLSESDTIQASLVLLGHTVAPFTGITAADWRAAGEVADAILIPELELRDLFFTLDAEARAAVQHLPTLLATYLD